MSAPDETILTTRSPERRLQSPVRIAARIRSGTTLAEQAFDRYLPADLRECSARHWTPLHVASLATRWLSDAMARSVLDIGSGAGKFCVAGALAGTCRFIGLEQRQRLIEVSRQLARDFAVEDRVEFIQGRLGEVDLQPVDAYYLYNPFAENFSELEDRVDDEVELSPERFVRDVKALKRFFAEIPARAYVITYHGFGGIMPPAFEEVRVARSLSGALRMWWKSPFRR